MTFWNEQYTQLRSRTIPHEIERKRKTPSRTSQEKPDIDALMQNAISDRYLI